MENPAIELFWTLQTEDEEFEHFIDEDEFEGFEKDKSQSSKSKEGQPELKMADVRLSLPVHITDLNSFLFINMISRYHSTKK